MIVMIRVIKPQSTVTIGDVATSGMLPLLISPIALPARERPMIATVGPITHAGIS